LTDRGAVLAAVAIGRSDAIMQVELSELKERAADVEERLAAFGRHL
jgi:hypothetical protein